jgi:hypothetical protein
MLFTASISAQFRLCERSGRWSEAGPESDEWHGNGLSSIMLSGSEAWNVSYVSGSGAVSGLVELLTDLKIITSKILRCSFLFEHFR